MKKKKKQKFPLLYMTLQQFPLLYMTLQQFPLLQKFGKLLTAKAKQ
jgi:hypothetical protein